MVAKMNTNGDTLHAFHLRNAAVRGHVVRLESTSREILGHADYAPEVSRLLGESLAASALFAGALKFEGRLSIQLRGAGALSLLLAECTDDGALRGIARCEEGMDGAKPDLAEAGTRLAITIENHQTDTRYQGLVPVDSATLAEAFEGYFERSEQLPTRIMLVERNGRCAGIMLQKVAEQGAAGQVADLDAWNRVGHLLATLSEDELLNLPVETLLLRLFHEEGVELQPARALRFECSCSTERVLGMLRALGRQQAFEALGEEAEMQITCEFCSHVYRLDSVDVFGLFADLPLAPGSSSTQ
jgi:molecular chaperone Hsp33